jgi:2-hydroxychromene-2-carboxylate isomerase
MAVRRTPRFYFSLRSPYSWLAYRDLLDRHATLAGRIEWIPFWEPDERSLRLLTEAGGEFVYTPMSRAKHLYVLGDMRRLAAARRLTFTWPVDRDPVWEIPHLAYLVARRQGAGPEFIAHAYRARWQEGQNICDPATIAKIAADLGLPTAEMAGAADDDAVRREGLDALLAIYRDGVFGVPFFTHGFDRYWGVDRLEAFAAAVSASTPAGEQAAAAGGAADSAPGRTDEGHAGGCG